MPSLRSVRSRRRALVSAVAAAAALAAVGPAAAAFPGANGRIVFSRGSYPIELYGVNPDGSDARVVRATQVVDGAPAWSPDGTQIAFIQSGWDRGNLYVTTADGAELRNLTYGPIPGSETSPAWSPDGTRIVFASDRLGSKGIKVMNLDGTGLRDVVTVDPQSSVGAPAWSPDGRTIVFAWTTGLGQQRLFAVDADGAHLRALTDSRLQWAVAPDWAPDGTRIAFVGYDGTSWGIYVTSADGTDLARLTDGTLFDYSPAWSPDGTQIAFSRWRDETGQHTDLFVMGADGSDVRQITTSPSYDQGPDWQPLPTPTSYPGARGAIAAVRATLRSTLLTMPRGRARTWLDHASISLAAAINVADRWTAAGELRPSLDGVVLRTLRTAVARLRNVDPMLASTTAREQRDLVQIAARISRTRFNDVFLFAGGGLRADPYTLWWTERRLDLADAESATNPVRAMLGYADAWERLSGVPPCC